MSAIIPLSINNRVEEKSICLPDLISHCDFPLAYHPNGDAITALSIKWLDHGCPDLSPSKRAKLHRVHAGKLVAYCYPTCSDERLRVIIDFMNFLFHMDDLSDGMLKHDADALSDVVMNALWFPEDYRPVKTSSREQPAEEITAGKLARE